MAATRLRKLPPSTDATFAYAKHGFVFAAFEAKENMPAIVRVFRRIVEQIGNDLAETYFIGLHPHRQVRQFRGLQCVLNDLPKIGRLLAQRNVATRNARHIHQIIDQACEVSNLTAVPSSLSNPLRVWGGSFAHLLLQTYYEERITLSELSGYLNLKVPYISDFETVAYAGNGS